jgi:hypothetical protein
MKLIRSIALPIFSLIILSSSCKKHVIQPVDQLSLLPPATQTGANTFGCLINGQAFVPQNQSFLVGPRLQCNYIYTAGGYYFTVGGVNKNGNGVESDIIVFTDSLAIHEGQTIKLMNDEKGNGVGEYFLVNPPYYTSKTLTGELTITHFDTVKQILSGNFYFNVISTANDTIKITSGRFDMPYTR